MAISDRVEEIVQLPAIVSAGKVELLKPEMQKLDKDQLKQIAVAFGGQLVYMKVRATYTELETALCNYDNCYRPVEAALWCDDHPNGMAKSSHSNNVRHIGMVNPKVS